MKEATARIKINKLLEEAGWRFFADSNGPATIQLEPGVTLKSHDLDALGENFEKVKKGYIDFLLLNEKGFPFIVLEAKAENKDPLFGKEQARKYAKSQNCRFVILSNGNEKYHHLSTCLPTDATRPGMIQNGDLMLYGNNSSQRRCQSARLQMLSAIPNRISVPK